MVNSGYSFIRSDEFYFLKKRGKKKKEKKSVIIFMLLANFMTNDPVVYL